MTDFITGTHKADLHGNYHHAIAQLSSTVNHSSIRQLYADMHGELVQLRRLDSREKPRKFAVTAAEADAFVEAWTQFKADCAFWEKAEAEEKAEEQAKELDRQLAVWREIETLYETVPGLEVTARENEVGLTTYDVKSQNGTYSETSIYTVDQVLKCVKKAIEDYDQCLSISEDDEKMGFPANSTRYRDDVIAIRKTFLAQHRAFLARNTVPVEA